MMPDNWKQRKFIIVLVASVLLFAIVILLSNHKPYDYQGPIPGSFHTKLVVEVNSNGSPKVASTVQKAPVNHVEDGSKADPSHVTNKATDVGAEDSKKPINPTVSSKDRQKGMLTSKLPATRADIVSTSSFGVTEANQRLQAEKEAKGATKLKDLPTIPSATKPLTVQPKKDVVSLRLPSGHMVTPERLNLPESSSDVFLSMKTGGSQGETRLSLTFLTWMQTINPKHVRVITDSGSGKWFSAAKNAGIQVIETRCPSGHGLTDLCCKSGTEFAQYYAARDRGEKYKWYCHVDDDMYINIPTLIRKLHSYNPSEMKYVGYWLSNLWGSNRMSNGNYDNFPEHVRKGYYYGDGPCYCISAPLMDAAEKYYRGADTLVSTCQRAGLPDDDTVGFVNDALLDVPLTHVPLMHTERTPGRIPPSELKNQISFGYSLQFNVRINVPNGRFDRRDDPSGMLSYHCLLYPQTPWCSK